MTFVSAVLQLQAGTATTRKGKMANYRWKKKYSGSILHCNFRNVWRGQMYCASLKWLMPCQSGRWWVS